MIIIEDQLDPNLRKLIKKRKQTAIIPVGSLEQHGPHLPISTDADIVTEIAKRIAKKCDLLLLPTIAYGVSFEHAPFFNLSISNSTLQKLLIDVCMSLSRNNIKNVIILNGHHGNQKALKNLSGKIKINSRGTMRVFVFSYWKFMEREFDHAGFVETSLMLAISKKNIVKMKLAKKGLDSEKLSKKEKNKISRLASKSFPKATKNGVWGDPTSSNAKDGREILSQIVRNLVKKSQTCLTEIN